MKKTTKQARAQEPQPLATELVIPLAMDKEALRDHISNLVCADAVEMVKTTVERVKQGQYPAMKYLFEMIGLFPATATPDKPQEDSLAGMLLKQLGIEYETPDKEAPVNHVK